MASSAGFAARLALGLALSVLFYFLFYYFAETIFGYSYDLLLTSSIALALFTFIGSIVGGSLSRYSALLLGLTLVLIIEELLINSLFMLYGMLLALAMTIVLPLIAVYAHDSARCLETYGIIFASRIVFIPLRPLILAETLSQPILYTLIFLAMAFYMRFRDIPSDFTGLIKGRLPIFIQVPVGITMGIVAGIIEYQILKPKPIGNPGNLIETLAYLVIVMLVFVAVTEELMFRGLLQNFVSGAVPAVQSILMVSVQFGLMHIGWGVPLELLFAYVAGVIFGTIYYGTKSLLMPIIIHGVGNITLYVLALLFV